MAAESSFRKYFFVSARRATIGVRTFVSPSVALAGAAMALRGVASTLAKKDHLVSKRHPLACKGGSLTSELLLHGLCDELDQWYKYYVKSTVWSYNHGRGNTKKKEFERKLTESVLRVSGFTQ